MISVVVPVYKSEKTLRRCVESILAQTDKDLEVILVVEAAPDPSGVLCDELASKDERIHVVNGENRGVSDARNRGIQAANGEYIRFVDSDDFIDPESNEKLLNIMKESDADLVIGGFNHLYYSRNIEKLPKNEDLRELYFDGFLNMPWNKLYKKRLIRELFPMDIDLGEDLVFNQSYLRGCKDYKIVQASVYDYIQDDRGTTLSTKRRGDRYRIMTKLYKKSKRFFHDMGVDDNGICAAKLIVSFLDEIIEAAFDKDMEKKDYLRLINRAHIIIDRIPVEERMRAERRIQGIQPDYDILYPLVRKGSVNAVRYAGKIRAAAVTALRMR